MKLTPSARPAPFPRPSRRTAVCLRGESASVFILVLWIAFGLVTIAIYFASAMRSELQVADNRAAGLAADQAIEGGARYVSAVLATYATNGTVPDVTLYQSQAVPVGDAHFWLIGRASDTNQTAPDQVFFGLVDEGSKLNLNTVTVDMLEKFTNMTAELAANIVDWRDTNAATTASGDGPSVYGQLSTPYQCKNAPYETVDELRLVYGMNMAMLFGEDQNLNGALDVNEVDTNRNGWVDPGLLDYVTVYSREPNTQSDGSARVNISTITGNGGNLATLLQTNLDAGQADQILANLGIGAGGGRPGGPGGGGGGPGGGATATVTFTSPLQFYIRSGMTDDEFAKIANDITVTNGTYIQGRVNVDTAPAAVLACLPGITGDLAQQLVTYRESNPDKLTSIAWVADALGKTSSAAAALAAGDYITTQSYQFTADIAALGPYGRGYRRVKFIFDTSTGTPRIIYRQDLSHLGWALGRYVRQTWILANVTR